MSESEEPIVRVALAGSTRDATAAADALEQWLAPRLGADSVTVGQVGSPNGTGVANENLMVDASWTANGETHTGGFVVRVGAASEMYLDADIETHARMYEALAGLPGLPVPRVIGFETDTSLLGDKFFAMERIDGQVPSDVPIYHVEGWVVGLSVEERHAMWRNAVELLVTLHQVPADRFDFLLDPARGDSGLAQVVQYWSDYARWAGAETNPVVQSAYQWLMDHFPADAPTALSWGDARVQNIIFQGVTPAAILDWDLVSLGGPECDLAWWMLMDHSNTAASGVQRLEGIGGRGEFLELWEQLMGRKALNLDFYVVFSAYRLAIILMRIGAMYASSRPEALGGPEDMQVNNIGLQYLAHMLKLPYEHPFTVPFDQFEDGDPLEIA